MQLNNTVAGEKRFGVEPEVRRDPVLDGIRGLAIALVMIYHFSAIPSPVGTLETGLARIQGIGWIGVDLFFILSGFLITGILLDTRWGAGYFRTFFARRALRIFPLYYSVLAILFLVLPLFLPATSPWVGLGWRQKLYWTYLGNADVTIHGWPMGIGHFWSLAVEEQFYLFWPVLVLLLNRRALMRLCWAVILVDPLVRLLVRHALGADAPYVLTITRADALAFGALLAIAARGQGLPALLPRARAAAAAAAAAFLVLVAWKPTFDHEDAVVGTVGFTIVGLLFASGMVLVLTAPSWRRVRGALRGRVLTGLGRYSYGLYVVHRPLGVALRGLFSVHGQFLTPRLLGSAVPFQLGFTAAGVALSGGLAWVSWRLIEEPALRLKKSFTYGTRSAPAAAPALAQDLLPEI